MCQVIIPRHCHPAKPGVLGYSAAITLVYVVPIACVYTGKPRNHPHTVAWRLIISALVCTLTWMPLAWVLHTQSDTHLIATLLGLHFSVRAVLIPLALTGVLFAGPLLYMLHCTPPHSLPQHPLVAVRNLIMAPLTEEWVFRACLLPLWLVHVRE